MKKFLKQDAKDFFFASRFATSLMNTLSVLIACLVIIAILKELFTMAVVAELSTVLLVPIAIVSVLISTYCIGTILFAFIVYFSKVN